CIPFAPWSLFSPAVRSWSAVAISGFAWRWTAVKITRRRPTIRTTIAVVFASHFYVSSPIWFPVAAAFARRRATLGVALRGAILVAPHIGSAFGGRRVVIGQQRWWSAGDEACGE